MVLHYLGLDHIGHVEGPHSLLVRPKLQEMDHIVERIHHRFIAWDKHFGFPSLLVVCGDHGMKNSGSHCGASLEEVLVPLVFIGKVCSGDLSSDMGEDMLTTSVPQIDLVPTLSVLLSLPIPTTNLGKMIPALLQNMPVSQQLYALYYNCKQVAAQFENNIVNSATQASYLEYVEAMMLHASWLTSSNSSKSGLAERIARLYMSGLTGMSSELADSLVTFDMPLLVAASGILWQILRLDQGQAICVVGTLLHLISLSSSSFIEEEHQVWYFFWLTFAVAILYKLCSVVLFNQSSVPIWRKHTSQEKDKPNWLLWNWLGLLFLHRILRKWNQTGDKWASLPDVGDWLIQQEQRTYLSVVLLLGLAAVCCCCLCLPAQYPGTYQWLIEAGLCTAAAGCVYCYRSAIGNVDIPFTYSHSRGVREVRIFWSILTLILAKGLGELLYEMKAKCYSPLCAFGCLLRTSTCCWLLICALLHRPHNVILIAAQVLMSKCVGRVYACHRSHTTNIWWLVIGHVWIGNVVYFYQGNSNRLATIDIASGYVGQIGYNPIVVGILLVINTYSAPVLSYLLLLSEVTFQCQGEGIDRFWEQFYNSHHCLALLRLLPVAVYVVLVTLLRYHLFVWTVFSPKLLYETMHTLVISLLMLLQISLP